MPTSVKIETSRLAAEALRPLAGKFASLLYTVDIFGVDFLSIPTHTGSAAYAFAETFHWKQDLDESFRGVRPFYAVVVVSTAVGVGLNFANVNPVQARFWTAIINGLLAPFFPSRQQTGRCRRAIIQNQSSSRLAFVVVALTTLLMFGAALGMLVCSRQVSQTKPAPPPKKTCSNCPSPGGNLSSAAPPFTSF
jgi:Mn2+/Fe2+ NRAMP family transporter